MLPLKSEFLYFLSSCEHLNFSHAAESLGIQQAAVSKAIKKLELEFDKALFIRRARKLKLTEFGTLLRSQLIKHENMWNKEFYELLEQYDALSGRLYLGVNETVAINSLSHVIAKLHKIDHNLHIEVNFDRSPDVTKKVVAGDYDFGFVVNPVKHPDLVTKKLEKEYTALWTNSTKESDPVLFYNPDMINANKFLKQYPNCKKVAVKSYELMGEMTKTSQGLFLLPNPIATKFKKLKKVGTLIEEFQLALIYRYDRPKTKAFQAVVDLIGHCYSA